MKQNKEANNKSSAKIQESKSKENEQHLGLHTKKPAFDPLDTISLYISSGNTGIIQEVLKAASYLGNQYLLRMIESLPPVFRPDIYNTEETGFHTLCHDDLNLSCNNFEGETFQSKAVEDMFDFAPDFSFFDSAVTSPNYINL